MLSKRIIPCLLLKDDRLVKTKQFKNPNYIGDPCNTIRIFNELEVDELIILDINSHSKNHEINYSLLKDIATEAFMPMGYGGGIRTLDQARKILEIGFEKIILNSLIFNSPSTVKKLVDEFGSQAVVGSVDYKNNFFSKKNYVYVNSGNTNTGILVLDYCKNLINLGIGEIFLTSINREGTWDGLDYDTIKMISENISIPLIAHGGAGTIDHISNIVNYSQATAVALGNMIVYQKKGMGVLVSFPDKALIETALSKMAN
jgi:cyclase